MNFNASRNTNSYRVRNLLGNLAALTNCLHVSYLTLDSVRNLTSLGFANHSSCANRNLLALGFANPAGYAVTLTTSFWLANNSSRAVVDSLRAWLTYVTSRAVVDNFRARLTNVLGSCARNLLTNLLASVLGAANLFGFASWNPNFLAASTIGLLAANSRAATRYESTATGAWITGP